MVSMLKNVKSLYQRFMPIREWRGCMTIVVKKVPKAFRGIVKFLFKIKD